MTRRGLHDAQGKALLGSDVPRMVAMPPHAGSSLERIASGEYHAFAVGSDGRVWAWGLNSFGQTGAAPDALRQANGDGAEDAQKTELTVATPTEVTSLAGTGVVALAGGGQHSLAICADGCCLAWGRVDSGQLALDLATVARDRLLADARGRIRACLVPTDVNLETAMANAVKNGNDVKGEKRGYKAVAVACGTGHTLIVASVTGRPGQTAVFGTGFNAQMQLGLGADADEEVYVPTLLQGKALQDRCVVWAWAETRR